MPPAHVAACVSPPPYPACAQPRRSRTRQPPRRRTRRCRPVRAPPTVRRNCRKHQFTNNTIASMQSLIDFSFVLWRSDDQSPNRNRLQFPPVPILTEDVFFSVLYMAIFRRLTWRSIHLATGIQDAYVHITIKYVIGSHVSDIHAHKFPCSVVLQLLLPHVSPTSPKPAPGCLHATYLHILGPRDMHTRVLDHL